MLVGVASSLPARWLSRRGAHYHSPSRGGGWEGRASAPPPLSAN